MNGLNEQAATDFYGTYAERHDRLVEAIGPIRQFWGGERISFAGRNFHTNALLYDVPATPPPIFVAAGGPESATLAGQHGDGWIAQAHDIRDPKLLAAFQSGAQQAGAVPVLHFPQDDPTTAIDFYRTTVLPKLH
ncbi:MAG: F420-dependent hydroxymycolic acid dehydrogenase [Mycobacterium sp.]|nr:F420-dependent hydroxymycolic acid dehydrogenase [Mycobacterium sp.]